MANPGERIAYRTTSQYHWYSRAPRQDLLPNTVWNRHVFSLYIFGGSEQRSFASSVKNMHHHAVHRHVQVLQQMKIEWERSKYAILIIRGRGGS
eukprot:scaffold2613_cov188-Amphora_coffeaeformis.AAC.2